MITTSNDRCRDDAVVATRHHVSRVDVTTATTPPPSTSSQNSTPTLAPRRGAAGGAAVGATSDGNGRTKQVERFVYEVDPELGAFV